MNTHFPRVISLLRREQKRSQKQVAADLGISQALLSHYEKGIRECGLDFVVKTANYYGVSCDYLLGRSADRAGSMLTVEELPDPQTVGKENAVGSIGLHVMLYKKLISNSLYLLYDLLAKSKNRFLVTEISNFLMLSVYRAVRVLFVSDKENQKAFFSAPAPLARAYADAAMARCEANAAAAAEGSLSSLPAVGEVGAITPVSITSQGLSEDYPLFYASMMNLIKNAEEQLCCEKSDGSHR